MNLSRALTVLSELLLFFFALTLIGFGQSATAVLSGAVQDQSGAVIASASVAVENLAKRQIRTTQTDQEGRYAFSNLEPGEYELRIEAVGFQKVALRGVVLTVGGQIERNATLAVADGDPLILTVKPPPIDATKTEISRVVTNREIQDLPIGGRNFVDFVKLSPGVAPGRENVGGGPFKEPDIAVGSAAAPRLSFGGQTELNTLIQVDGADNIQTVTGLPRATPSQEAVQEFRVLNNSYLSEYGRSLGGFVNIVTKSGANAFSGSAYYFGVNDALNADPLLAGDNPVLRQNQFGATLGGPIRRDRVFFFANYEGQRRAESNRFSQVIVSNLDAINAAKRFYGLSPETVNQIRTSDYDQFLTKIDASLNAKNTVSVRWNLLDSEAKGFLGGGGRASPASSTARDNRTFDQAVVGSLTSVVNPNVVNDLRVQWAGRSFDFQPQRNEPALDLPNLLILGKSTSDVDFYRESRVQISETLGVIAGRHQAKFGFDYGRLNDGIRWDLFYPARIIFPGLLPALLNQVNGRPSPLPGVFWWPVVNGASETPSIPVPFTQAVPDAVLPNVTADLTHSSYGFFAQDQWNVAPKLTVTYGMRYDFETYPRRYLSARDLNNFQPRVGLSYAYSKKGVIRAGYGIFTDRTASSVGQVFFASEWVSRGDAANAPTLFPTVARFQGRFRQATIGGPVTAASPIGPVAATNIFFFGTSALPAGYALPAGASAGPGILPSPTAASGATTNFTDNVNSRLRNPYAQQASLQIEHEIGGGFVASAAYLYVLALKLPGHTQNLNAIQTGVLPTGKPIFGGRRFAELGGFHVTDNIGASTYHGGTFELNRRFDRGVSVNASYTWSKTITTVDSINNLADYPEGDFIERALSRQHVAHRFTLAFTGEIPRGVAVLRGVKLSSIVSLESGRFFNVFAGGDFNGDGNPNSDRPGMLPRNSFEGPGFASVDIRAAREFSIGERVKAEVTVDAFNALNRVNIRDLNLAYGGTNLALPPNPLLQFGTPRDVFGARQIQFGMKLRF